jgi:hypothetical protein
MNNKLIISLLLLVLSCKEQKETKPVNYTIEWDVYDSLGNLTYYIKRFNYPPTKQDSIDFRKEMSESFKK